MRAEPAADVECAADMLGPGIVDGQAIEFLATGALGHQIDAAAASRTPRGRAVDEGAGAVQHLDRLGEYGRHKLARGDAVPAADADINSRHDKAANDAALSRAPTSPSWTDR